MKISEQAGRAELLVSGSFSRRSSERWPKRPCPDSTMTDLVQRHGKVPPENRVVEEVEPEPEPIASQRVPLGRDVESRRPRRVDFLASRPRQSCVVEEQAIQRRQLHGKESELNVAHQRKPQLDVRDRDAASEELHCAAVRWVCPDHGTA